MLLLAPASVPALWETGGKHSHPNPLQYVEGILQRLRRDPDRLEYYNTLHDQLYAERCCFRLLLELHCMCSCAEIMEATKCAKEARLQSKLVLYVLDVSDRYAITVMQNRPAHDLPRTKFCITCIWLAACGCCLNAT